MTKQSNNKRNKKENQRNKICRQWLICNKKKVSGSMNEKWKIIRAKMKVLPKEKKVDWVEFD